MHPLARHPAHDRPLRIGMLAPIAWRVPPRHYGPWERVVSLLTEGLVRSGADVTLFATADAQTTACLSAVVASAYEETPGMDVKVWEGLHLAHTFGRAGDFDLIHNHYDFLPLTYASLVGTPMVTTIHGFSSKGILPVYRAFNGRAHYVSISGADRHPDLTYLATIHHGIDLAEFTFSPHGGGGLVFLGRIHPDKGTADAIRVARAAGRPLLIAGIVQDRGYFETEVKPYLGADVRYVGSVGPAERDALLGGAAALLHLIHFDEPFGLSVIEAMACGTPIIAYPRGSMPELVADGVSGFLVPDEASAVQAVDRLGTLNRSAVRIHAERFSVDAMVDRYLAAYHQVLTKAEAVFPYDVGPLSVAEKAEAATAPRPEAARLFCQTIRAGAGAIDDHGLEAPACGRPRCPKPEELPRQLQNHRTDQPTPAANLASGRPDPRACPPILAGGGAG